jgi:hypothetical protein
VTPESVYRDVVVFSTATSTSRLPYSTRGGVAEADHRARHIIQGGFSPSALAGFALATRTAKTDVWMTPPPADGASPPVADLPRDDPKLRPTQVCPRARKPIDKALKYSPAQRPFMDYPTFLAHGLPIASGVIEGACRHLHVRGPPFGITGARWDLPGAEAILMTARARNQRRLGCLLVLPSCQEALATIQLPPLQLLTVTREKSRTR